VGSAVAIVLFWLVVDRFTLGVLPDPYRAIPRWQRIGSLERTLLVNPHDRRARAELAEHYVARKKYQKAMEVLRPNLEAGDEDPAMVFTMGVACLGAGHAPQGEKLLGHVEELDPRFRLGEVDLARGTFRLQRDDYAGAKEALEKLVALRKGTVEGRVKLAQALEGLKEDGKAALMKDEAWAEYVASPGFQRRKERKWAWRARPSRPRIYLTAVLAGLFLFYKFAAPQLRQPEPTAYDGGP
jgi:tetratricopeptide (TPR) repeat protein